MGYWESGGLSREIEKLLATATDYMASQNFVAAFDLAKAVLESLSGILNNCDDSNGDISECMTDAIGLLKILSANNKVSVTLKEALLQYIQALLQNKDYFDYGDYGYDLMELYTTLAAQLQLPPDTVMNYLDKMINTCTEQFSDYKKEWLIKTKINYLKDSGRTVEAEKLMAGNMDIVEIRKTVAEKAIAEKDYAAAQKIIRQGIDIAKNLQHSGRIYEWERLLLHITVLEKDITSIRHYTYKFAVDNGFSETDYRQWKSTYSKEEWPAVIENTIAEKIKKATAAWGKMNKLLRGASPFVLREVAAIYIEEGMQHRLLAALQKEASLGNLQSYYTYLVKSYPDELLALYLPALQNFAIEANSRNDYQKLTGIMKQLVREMPGGLRQIKDLAQQLSDRFSAKPRRPAMLEELGKVLRL